MVGIETYRDELSAVDVPYLTAESTNCMFGYNGSSSKNGHITDITLEG